MSVSPDLLPPGLSKAEAARLEFLISADEAFTAMIEDLAGLWRTRLRVHIADAAQCRSLLLAHTTLLAARYAVVFEAGPRLASALSLAIISRVEQCVDELDRKEDARAN